MFGYIIRRSIYSVFIIFGVLIVTFILFRLAAGDPAGVLLGKNPSPKDIEELHDKLGLDKPLIWGHWLKTECFTNYRISDTDIKRKGMDSPDKNTFIFRKNFDVTTKSLKCIIRFKGTIYLNGKKIESSASNIQNIIFRKLPDKIIIKKVGDSLIKEVSFFKYQENPWNSQFTESVKELVKFIPTPPYVSFFNFGNTLLTNEPVTSVLLRGIFPSLSVMLPIFTGELILGIILALISVAFKDSIIDKTIVILSVAGMSLSYLVFIILAQWYVAYYLNLFPVWGWGSPRYIILPIATGIISGLGSGVRFYRTIFVNELNKEYLRTAAAKGCSQLRIYSSHLLKNALIPIIARSTTILPFLFTGSLLLETFFGIPGLGYTGINALMNADIQMLKALVVFSAILFVLINLFADIAYAWADPRIRLK